MAWYILKLIALKLVTLSIEHKKKPPEIQEALELSFYGFTTFSFA